MLYDPVHYQVVGEIMSLYSSHVFPSRPKKSFLVSNDKKTKRLPDPTRRPEISRRVNTSNHNLGIENWYVTICNLIRPTTLWGQILFLMHG